MDCVPIFSELAKQESDIEKFILSLGIANPNVIALAKQQLREEYFDERRRLRLNNGSADQRYLGQYHIFDDSLIDLRFGSIGKPPAAICGDDTRQY